jgi:hypothetical protein
MMGQEYSVDKVAKVMPDKGEKLADMEEQLATIIELSRNVAVVAEELLREVNGILSVSSDSEKRKIEHTVLVAPRLLAATDQQLQSLLALLKSI